MNLRRVAPLLLLAVFVAAPRTALACPVCFGATDSPMQQASNMGILALLIVTVAMLGAFGLFFLHLMRRAADAAGAASNGVPRLREGRLR